MAVLFFAPLLMFFNQDFQAQCPSGGDMVSQHIEFKTQRRRERRG